MEDILRKLVAFPSVSGNQTATHQLLDYVAGFVASRGMHVTWYESAGFESLVASVQPGHKTPKVMLAAHADVVPTGNGTGFALQHAGGRYLGRGVLDMKFALAAYLQLVDDLRTNLRHYDIGLMVTGDEEVGGRNGTAKLVDEGYIPAVCVLPDGGDNWQVQTASKGIWVFRISADGRSAHGSRPWLGDNALQKLMATYQDIRGLFPEQLGPDTNTITLSQLNGGQAMNQVPDEASMLIDVRTINSAEHARLYEMITGICRRHGIRQEHISDGAPTQTDLSHPLVAPFVSLVTEVTGVPAQGYHALGSSDARFLVPYGVPYISVYPAGGNLHADGEWLDAQAFQDFYTILRRYIEIVAKT